MLPPPSLRPRDSGLSPGRRPPPPRLTPPRTLSPPRKLTPVRSQQPSSANFASSERQRSTVVERSIDAPGSPPPSALNFTRMPGFVSTPPPVAVGPTSTPQRPVFSAELLRRETHPFSPTDVVVEALFESKDGSFLYYDMLRQEVDTTNRDKFDTAVKDGVLQYLHDELHNYHVRDSDVWIQIRPGLMSSVLLSYAATGAMPTMADTQWPLRFRVAIRCHPRDDDLTRRQLAGMPSSVFATALRLYELWFGRSVMASRISVIDLYSPETLVGGLLPIPAAQSSAMQVASLREAAWSTEIAPSPTRDPIASPSIVASRSMGSEANNAGVSDNGSPQGALPEAAPERRLPTTTGQRKYPSTLPAAKRFSSEHIVQPSSAPVQQHTYRRETSRGDETAAAAARWQPTPREDDEAIFYRPGEGNHGGQPWEHHVNYEDADKYMSVPDVRKRMPVERRGDTRKDVYRRAQVSSHRGDPTRRSYRNDVHTEDDGTDESTWTDSTEDEREYYHHRSHSRGRLVVPEKHHGPKLYVNGDGTEFFVRVHEVKSPRGSPPRQRW